MADPWLHHPSDWELGTLEPDAKRGFVRRVDIGGTPRTTCADYWGGDIPWLTPKDIAGYSDGIFVSQSERMLTKAGLASCPAKVLPSETVLLSKRAPVGLVAVNSVPMATNQGFLAFRCGPKLRPLYLAFWLRANLPYLAKIANGSTYPELYTSDLFEVQICVPQLAVQDDIIDLLCALQFVAFLGKPLEQSVTSPSQMTEFQAQSRRLVSLCDRLLPLLLSGGLSTVDVRTRFLEGVA